MGSQQEAVSNVLHSWQEVSIPKALLGKKTNIFSFFHLPWQSVMNWSLIWLSHCQTVSSLSGQSPMWAGDLKGCAIPHVPSLLSTPPPPSTQPSPTSDRPAVEVTQQEPVSPVFHSSLHPIFLLGCLKPCGFTCLTGETCVCAVYRGLTCPHPRMPSFIFSKLGLAWMAFVPVWTPWSLLNCKCKLGKKWRKQRCRSSSGLSPGVKLLSLI